MDREEERDLNRSPNAIAIMAKQPLPGTVKTRLSPPLTPMQASYLYRAFLCDTIALVEGIPGSEHLVAYEPQTAGDFFIRLVPRGFRCIPQGQGDLGAKLCRISRRLFFEGYERIILIASDTPHLPRAYLAGVLQRLDHSDVVLGPCYDGGYYLIGTRLHLPFLYSDMPWSTSQVCSLTLERAKAKDLTTHLLPSWYDLDTLQDVKRLSADLRHSPSRHFFSCPGTLRAIEGLGY